MDLYVALHLSHRMRFFTCTSCYELTIKIIEAKKPIEALQYRWSDKHERAQYRWNEHFAGRTKLAARGVDPSIPCVIDEA
jgi:hypothetical protein